MTAPRNYVETIMQALERELGAEYGCLPSLLRIYALLVLLRGSSTTLADVHDAWSCWRAPGDPTHRSLVPFGDLDQEVQELDRPYRDAICRVALAMEAGSLRVF